MMKKYPDNNFNGLGSDDGSFQDPMKLLILHKGYHNLTDEFYEEDEEDYFERDID